ncbi:immediate early response 3-interacting protein 1 [Tupaia chinensis]|uniref:immediate early response 3-interacting protein 1 n=1 Tax=Tupaia chinensis TaxID=246437 RepID=UPI0007040023|nr:immediate early response 3-interacting protein 1 [Tupaia chinensis]
MRLFCLYYCWHYYQACFAPHTLTSLPPELVCYSSLCHTVGWATDQGIGGFGEEPGIKSQLMNLIRSVRTVMRVPLIIVNSVAIVLLLLFG